jgi:Fe-S cluster assembly ATP-binding protein
MMSEPLLQVEDLSLRRNGCEILHQVNLSVHPGQVHALLGLNGSGKSSLAYAIMGCEGYTPDSCRVLFDEQEMVGLSITERARLGITLAW